MFKSSTAFGLAGAVLCLAATTGCSDQNAANEKNFSAAIEAFLASDPECVHVPDLASLPGEKSAEPRGFSSSNMFGSEKPTPVSVEEFLSRNKPEAALTSIGLIDVKITQREAEPYPRAGRTTLQSFAEINLTDKGKQWYRVVSGVFGKQASFCFAKKELAAIQNFTQPAEAMGQKISRVAYTWKLGDVADWAKDGALIEANPRLRATLERASTPQSGQAVLVLTNNGWIHEKLFRTQAN